MINLSVTREVNNRLDDGEDLSMKNSDKARVGVDTDNLLALVHSDNNSVTRVARLLDNNWMTHQLDDSMPQDPLATTQGLDESMVCGQSIGATTRAQVLAETQRLNDSMACRQSPRGPTNKGLRIDLS